jgi:hypothetical protein
MSWTSLAELAEREEQAVADHRWDDLLEIQDERRGVLAGLEQPLPAEARPALERALERSNATQQALVGAMAETKGAIGRLGQGRRAIGAYGAGATGRLEARA